MNIGHYLILFCYHLLFILNLYFYHIIPNYQLGFISQPTHSSQEVGWRAAAAFFPGSREMSMSVHQGVGVDRCGWQDSQQMCGDKPWLCGCSPFPHQASHLPHAPLSCPWHSPRTHQGQEPMRIGHYCHQHQGFPTGSEERHWHQQFSFSCITLGKSFNYSLLLLTTLVGGVEPGDMWALSAQTFCDSEVPKSTNRFKGQMLSLGTSL